MKTNLGITAVLLFAVSAVSIAASAPWYQWKSKLDGKLFCGQTKPGDGWIQDSGPYKDARCSTPGKPGE